MPSNFPGGLDSFTTKVDGIDDIMADHVNDLQNSVVAVETLLLAKLTGWVNWPTQPVYVSATSIRFNSIDLTTLFPVGTKIRLTQTTVKYFYVILAVYSGGNTTLTLYAGNMFSVTNAAITGFGFSHGLAYGFPEWFDYLPDWTAATTNPTLGNGTLTGRFCLAGKLCIARIYLLVGSTTSVGVGAYSFTYPINPTEPKYVAGIYNLRDAGSSFYFGNVYGFASTFALLRDSNIYVTNATPFGLGNTDYLHIDVSYEI